MAADAIAGSLESTCKATPEDVSLLEIPAPNAKVVEMRFASLTERDRFDPARWTRATLSSKGDGWHTLNLATLGLADGEYEYEFILDGRTDDPIPDPKAKELTRLGGYRGILRIRGGHRYFPPFQWDDEILSGVTLPENNKIVIYELPLRWMKHAPEHAREVGLGDFDHLIFEHLKKIAGLGVNAIELLPVQDSPDTLNWGYGTRFFFCPDIDYGTPVDLKFFIKECHKRGIRVILDVVMNHAKECPLDRLAKEWYFCDKSEEPGREDWGGRLFRFKEPMPKNEDKSKERFLAREFLYEMAEYWVREYHIDGFRIDEFKGIDHWEFVQTFRDRAAEAHKKAFPGRPFIVIAEDSHRRSQATKDSSHNPNGRAVVDSIWNFAFRDEAQRLLTNEMHTNPTEPSRLDRIKALIANDRMWEEMDRKFREGFSDLCQAVNYISSHDVEKEGEERFMNRILERILPLRKHGDGSIENVRDVVDGTVDESCHVVEGALTETLDRAGSAFGLLMTSVGIPMFLAGEEVGDVHDLTHSNWQLKMSDPVDFERVRLPGHDKLRERVRDFIRLRTSHPALCRNEVEFIHNHPTINDNDGVRVFAYCRTDGRPLGENGQVLVVANAGPHSFDEYKIEIPRGWTHIDEHGIPPNAAVPERHGDQLALSLAPYEVRVFTT